MSRTLQPCGCTVVTDETAVIINGRNVSPLVSNISHIEFCPEHGAQHTFTMIDQMIEDAIFKFDSDHLPRSES